MGTMTQSIVEFLDRIEAGMAAAGVAAERVNRIADQASLSALYIFLSCLGPGLAWIGLGSR